MTNTNNSGNSSNGTITITGAGGGGGGTSTGGTIVLNPGTGTSNSQWITVNIPSGQQFTIQGIDWAVPVEENENKSDGCSCKKCKEFFEYAEPNQEDGTLICWACRHGY